MRVRSKDHGVVAGKSSLVILLGGDSRVSLLNESLFETIRLGKLDERLLALTDDEDVGHTGGEGLALGVLDVDDLVGTRVVLDMHESTNTTDVISSEDEHGGAVLEFDNAVDFTGLKVQLKGATKY